YGDHRGRALDPGLGHHQAPPDAAPDAGERIASAGVIPSSRIRHNHQSRIRRQEDKMKQVEVAVIGVGWCGGIRAEMLAKSALVDKIHLCEIKPERLAEVTALINPATSTLDYQDIINNKAIEIVYISTTPESSHYPIARDCLKAGKHVLLEK